MRGNKYRRLEQGVHSLARWSSPSSASWTSCLGPTSDRRRRRRWRWWRGGKLLEVSGWLVKAAGGRCQTRLYVWMWRKPQWHSAASLQSRLRGRGLCCEGREWVPMALLTCVLCAASSAPRTFMCRVSRGVWGHKKLLLLFLKKRIKTTWKCVYWFSKVI